MNKVARNVPAAYNALLSICGGSVVKLIFYNLSTRCFSQEVIMKYFKGSQNVKMWGWAITIPFKWYSTSYKQHTHHINFSSVPQRGWCRQQITVGNLTRLLSHIWTYISLLLTTLLFSYNLIIIFISQSTQFPSFPSCRFPWIQYRDNYFQQTWHDQAPF